ncbi:response regulator [Methanolacinia paynteri]|uniref:response regulator n=1 Tax=Methanolacinia paynteri TaxID=230356 RepID=UPI00064FD8E4|nr:response regulator [Methanolacinia paynteri]
MVMILVTDDSAFQRNIIISILKDHGYEYREAANGIEAAEAALKYRPDLILLDIYMPDSGGFDFMEEAGRLELDIPVVILTSDIQDTTREKCLELGASGFLNKPVVKEDLLEKISDLVHVG